MIKRSRSNRIIGLLVSIVFALSLFVPGIADAAERSDKAEAGKSFTALWMSYLPDSTNITDISIPGSHDAGTAL